MSTSLSSLIDKRLIEALRRKLARGSFPGISLEHAMKFLLTDGMLPASDEPAQSYLALEEWVRADRPTTFTATELKNKTGQVLAAVARGERVIIERHGRPIAEMRAARSDVI